MSRDNIRSFAEIGLGDLDQVGGKNASLGEMIGNLASAGVSVPDGFATTADAYRRFMSQTALDEQLFEPVEEHVAARFRDVEEADRRVGERTAGRALARGCRAFRRRVEQDVITHVPTSLVTGSLPIAPLAQPPMISCWGRRPLVA